MFIWEGGRLSCKRAYFTVALRKVPQLSEAKGRTNATPMSSLHQITACGRRRYVDHILHHNSALLAFVRDTNLSMGSS